MSKRYSIICLVLALACYQQAVLATAPEPAGKVRFFNQADSDFDAYTKNPDPGQQAWMRNHYARMLVYSPYFDSRLAWYENGLVYVDSYAIYEKSPLAKQHPEWILRDGQGNKLYIPWNCQHGRCDQFAGDFSNPAFKTFMIENMRAILVQGYKGLWLDDVNLTWRVSDGTGKHVTPMDTNTGKPMTIDDWQRYFAGYMQEIRTTFPKIEIAHNAIWQGEHLDKVNSFITQQIKAADYINLERGGTDSGLVAGDGQWGFERFLQYIDNAHSLGTSVILMDYGSTESEREYGLASWLLINQDHDLIASNQLAWTAPDKWWSGYDVNLGAAINTRYKWQGLLRRDFKCGMVLLNQPNQAEIVTDMAAGYKTLSGRSISRLQLGAKSAVVLTKECVR